MTTKVTIKTPNLYQHKETKHFIERSTVKELPGYGEWMVIHWRDGIIMHEAKTKKECITYCDNI